MPDQNPESNEPQPAVVEATPERAPKPARRTRRTVAARRKTASRKTSASSRSAKPEKAAKPAPRKRVSRFVVLFRHGLAEEHSAEKADGDRSLTADGHAKTKRAARGMHDVFPDADTLFASPLLRAMQTALWLTKAYGDKLKIQVTDALLPSADPALLAELIASQDGRNIIVVGHEPHLSDSFAHLVGIKGSLRADLRKAGGIGIRLDEHGRGTLEWMLAPRMLRKLG